MVRMAGILDCFMSPSAGFCGSLSGTTVIQESGSDRGEGKAKVNLLIFLNSNVCPPAEQIASAS